MWKRIVTLGIGIAAMSFAASGFSRIHIASAAIANPSIEKHTNPNLSSDAVETAQAEDSSGSQRSLTGGLTEGLTGLRSRLTNLETLPLFLPPSQGTLESASDQLSTTQLSRPSFAWIRDQVATRYATGEGLTSEIVDQWQAYTTIDNLKYVDVVVNKASWERLNYIRRYGFVVQFGTVAQRYGYHLRIFHTGDAANRTDAITLETQTGRTISRPIRLRGAYFCLPTDNLSTNPSIEQSAAAPSTTCTASVAP